MYRLETKLETLDNGLTVITATLPYYDFFKTAIFVGAGSRYETKENNGISHVLEHNIFKGSRKYTSKKEIAKLIEGNGGALNASTSVEVVQYWMKSPALDQIEKITDILSSMMEPLLDETEFEREKTPIIQEINGDLDDPVVLAFQLYKKRQFGDTPLGWDTAGNETNVRSFTSQTAIDYMNDHYSPKNMVLVYVGNLPENILEIAQKYYLSLPQRSSIGYIPYERRYRFEPNVGVCYKKMLQTVAILGVECHHRFDEKKYASNILATILGGGMSCRLDEQVRDIKSLAYSISAGTLTLQDTGFLYIKSDLPKNKGKIKKGIQAIKDELDKISSELISEEELQNAKDYIIGHLAMSKADVSFLVSILGRNFIQKGYASDFEKFTQSINNVSRDDILSVAQDLFRPEKYNLQIVGPVKDPEPYFKILAA